MTKGTSKPKVAVIGAGASGMMAAAELIKGGIDVVIYEKNSKCGRKLAITGKGRCNVTNNCDTEIFLKNIPTNSKFMYSAINHFSTADTISFFENIGVPLKTERGNRVFPVSDKAYDIVDALYGKIKNNVVYKNVKKIILNDNGVFSVVTDDEQRMFDKVIVATGGLSYQLTGSTGDGYRFADSLGIDVINPVPSLIPLTSPDKMCSEMMGLSLKNVTLSLVDSGKILFSEIGEMMFTHFGITGPLVLSASAYADFTIKKEYTVCIDLKPGLTFNELDARLLKDFGKNINKDYANSLNDLLPSKMIPVFIRKSMIDPKTKVNNITKDQRKMIEELLKNFPVVVNGTRPINEAIITKGGISVKELSPKNFETRKIKGLYFIGETIDVDGLTGGFNIQIAFSSAMSCADSIICE